MIYSLKTDKGIIRTVNQDACFADMPDNNSCFAVVCDGMGGARAGDIASSIAVKEISERVMSGWRPNITPSSIENLLISSIAAANICVYDESLADKEKNGMGTTVVAAAVTGNICIIAHAGDSRAYLIGEENRRLTRDHSFVQALVDSGIISEEEAENHPKKNYITRALGVNEHVDIDFNSAFLIKGDKILLCSDGLTNYVTESDIFQIVHENTCDDAAEKLISLANHQGGGDNVTVVIISL